MILSCHDLCKSFGTDDILVHASFGIEEHEKAAIVGINGAGKSTLLKIIVGEEKADNGEVTLSKDKTIGYLAQQGMLHSHKTIYEEVREVKESVFEMERTLRSLELEMKEASGAELDSLMEEYHHLNTDFENANGYAVESEITGVLKGLGFSEDEFGFSTDTLSGGQKTRVALARLLLEMPDVLLLDEPTNHLDINAISWLENYLLNYKGAVLIVSHDRYFLNRIVTKVIEIDRGKMTTFQGNYSDYSFKKEEMRRAALKAYLHQQAQIKHQEEVITKLRQFNREKSIRRAESREKQLARIQVLDKPVDEDTQIHLTLEPRIESGRDVMKIEHLAKAFGYNELFSDLTFDIRRGERVALIGDNGTGKSTLLKIIMGIEEADSGKITLGSRVNIGYYDQEHQVLHAQKNLFDELQDEYPELDNTKIRNTLAAFLFTGDDVFKLISEISGGERGRVSLAKLMLSRANFLILDEPTNHLDIFSKEILESALCDYTGTVLYVSHDRYFINQTATRILELKDTRLINYIGNYDYYLEKRETLQALSREEGLKEKSAARPSPFSGAAAENSSGSIENSDSRVSWEKSKELKAAQARRRNELKKTETEISALEEEDRRIDDDLSREEVFTNLEQVTALSRRKEEIQEQLAVLYDRWEELAE